MSNVYVLRSHTKKYFNMSKKLASAYNNVHRRMAAYLERSQRMHYVYVHMQAYDHTLAYADTIRSGVTALNDVLSSECLVGFTRDQIHI